MLNRKQSVSTGLIFAFLILTVLGSFAQNSRINSPTGNLRSTGWIDWQSENFVLQVTFEPDDRGRSLPLLRTKAETVIERHLPDLFVEAVSAVLITSRQTIGEAFIESPEKTAEFRKIATEGKVASSRFTRDFAAFQRVFHFSLYPTLSRHFVTHSQAVSNTAELNYVASGNYSGIVIYVDDPIEMFGTHVRGHLQPALFPRVYDDDMNLIIDRRMVQPEVINSHGMVNYYHTSHIEKIHSRVGEVPLYVHAQALFGIYSTDLILTDRAARKIKADSHTLALITQGRIAIVSSARLP